MKIPTFYGLFFVLFFSTVSTMTSEAIALEDVKVNLTGNSVFIKTTVSSLMSQVTEEHPLKVSISFAGSCWISFFKCGEVVPVTNSSKTPKMFLLAQKTVKAIEKLSTVTCAESPEENSVTLIIGTNNEGPALISFEVLKTEDPVAPPIWNTNWDQYSSRYEPLTKYTKKKDSITNVTDLNVTFDDFVGFNMSLSINNSLKLTGDLTLVVGEIEDVTVLVATAVFNKTEIEALQNSPFENSFDDAVVALYIAMGTVYGLSGPFIVTAVIIVWFLLNYHVDVYIRLRPVRQARYNDMMRGTIPQSVNTSRPTRQTD